MSAAEQMIASIPAIRGVLMDAKSLSQVQIDQTDGDGGRQTPVDVALDPSLVAVG